MSDEVRDISTAPDLAIGDSGAFREALEAADARAEVVMRAAGESYAVPPSLQRDTPEATLAALSKSYEAAVRKITEQGNELAQYRALVADYEQRVDLPPVDESLGWQDETELGPEYQVPARTNADILQQALALNPHAQQAVAAAMHDPRVQAMANQAVMGALNADRDSAVVHEGWRLAVEANPAIADKVPQISNLLAADPTTPGVIQSGSAMAVAGQIGEAYKAVSSSEAMPELQRAMKLGAQSMSGAGGRPPAAGSSRWDEIARAKGGLEL